MKALRIIYIIFLVIIGLFNLGINCYFAYILFSYDFTLGDIIFVIALILLIDLTVIFIVHYNNKQILNISIENNIATITSFLKKYQIPVDEKITISKTSTNCIFKTDKLKLHIPLNTLKHPKYNKLINCLTKENFPNADIRI